MVVVHYCRRGGGGGGVGVVGVGYNYCSWEEDARSIKTGFSRETCRSNYQLKHLLRSGDFSLVPHAFDQMPQRNVVSTNLLISSYAKSGNLTMARDLFDRMPHRTTVTWTILMGAYSPKEAFRLYALMHRSCHPPDHVTFATLLSGATGIELQQVHAHIVKLISLDTNLMLCNCLIDSYCKSRCLHLALHIFNHMTTARDSVTFNSIITGYTKHGFNLEAINLFIEMQRSTSLKPTDFTFAAVLSSATGLSVDASLGQGVHASALKANYASNVFVANALLDLYTKHGLVHEAKKLFYEMPQLDCVSYNVLITAYARDAHYSSSLHLFRQLQQQLIRRVGFDRKQLPFATMLYIAATTVHLEMGRQIHSQAIVTRAVSEVKVGNSLVDMYTKCDRFEDAVLVFGILLECRNSIPWTAMISACVLKGLHERALRLFNDMHRANESPDQATFATILKAASNLASLSFGKQLHSFIIRLGFTSNVFCGSALVDMYAKCGSLGAAIQTFREMPERNVVSWNALISAYAQNGEGEAALLCFRKMVESGGLQPDSASFLSILTACSHRGLVEEGLEHFHSMSRVYELVPKREHYASVIDMLCRSGRFAKADEFMAEMPFEPDEIMWSSILNSCKIYRNQQLANKAAESLFNMDKLRDGAAYVTMSNIYAADGQWDNARKVKQAMRDRGVKKVPAYSWVEVKHKIHVFSANDKVHPQMEDIVKKIDMLSLLMEKQGFKPDLSCAHHNVDEETKLESLKFHSERLALAFALISTPEGSPILIMKNLRACTDCHAAIKLISKILDREITVRDSSRFHHFRGGLCSCKDYW